MVAKILDKSGIYEITINPNKIGCDRRYYIGQTINFKTRINGHKKALIGGKHKNVHMQNAFNLYGIDAFSFNPILFCEPNCEILNTYEKLILDFYIETYGRSKIYNIQLECINSRLGLKTPEETRIKQSIAATGKKKSEEHCKNISKSKQGFSPSKEHMEMLRIGNIGRKLNENQKQALLKSHLGKKKSKEEIEKRQETRRKNAELRGRY